MIADGATVIDVGGESTRPGASVVEVDEEIRRVVPVVEALAELDVVISIDTSQPEVIQAAVAAGAHIWNDVRALTRPNALETAAELNIPVIIMHMRGEPTTMNGLDQYDNVTLDVMTELSQRVSDALKVGVKAENIMIDPGFGFAKNAKQNLKLLKEFHQLNQLGVSHLVRIITEAIYRRSLRWGRCRPAGRGFCSGTFAEYSTRRVYGARP